MGGGGWYYVPKVRAYIQRALVLQHTHTQVLQKEVVIEWRLVVCRRCGVRRRVICALRAQLWF